MKPKTKSSKAAPPLRAKPATPAPRKPARAAAKKSAFSTTATGRTTQRLPAQKLVPAIPPLLLEGDPVPPPPPLPVSPPITTETIEVPRVLPPVAPASPGQSLPATYESEHLYLVAVSPWQFFAHWDFSSERLEHFRTLSADGSLTLHVRPAEPGSPVEKAIATTIATRHAFIEVSGRSKSCIAELGYFDHASKWVCIASSGVAYLPLEPPPPAPEPRVLAPVTAAGPPPSPISPREGGPRVDFGEFVRAAMADSVPALEASQQFLATHGFPHDPTALELSGLQPAEIHRIIESLMDGNPSCSSAETVLTAPAPQRSDLHPQIGVQIQELLGDSALPTSTEFAPAILGESPPPGPRPFWLNVNAELVVYGATEPDATVRLGGRKVTLRPDGTFSFRFALPDGHYSLRVEATAADGTEGREVALKFSRDTKSSGTVGVAQTDPALHSPR